MIKVSKLELEEILVLEYEVKEDHRGQAIKRFSKDALEKVGICVEFVEESIYCAKKKGTLYGIHYQNEPKAQSKLLYCTKGRGLDFAVDLRKTSKTYKNGCV